MTAALSSFIKDNGGGVSLKIMKKLYVGNLPYNYNDAKLGDLFSEFGAVASATVIIDRMSGRSKGFGFVELEDADAEKAMAEMNGKEVDGRTLKVNEAMPMKERR